MVSPISPPALDTQIDLELKNSCNCDCVCFPTIIRRAMTPSKPEPSPIATLSGKDSSGRKFWLLSGSSKKTAEPTPISSPVPSSDRLPSKESIDRVRAAAGTLIEDKAV